MLDQHRPEDAREEDVEQVEKGPDAGDGGRCAVRPCWRQPVQTSRNRSRLDPDPRRRDVGAVVRSLSPVA
jgi:hypothetical protein